MDHFRDLWLRESDVSRLLDPQKRASRWSKFYMRPLIWLASRSRLGRLLMDEEVRQKISMFTPSRWFQPPFDGQHLTRPLMAGPDSLGAPAHPRASLVPAGPPRGLFLPPTTHPPPP